MTQKDEKNIPPEVESFYVDEFRPEDAEGIVRLFRSVYGDGYPIKLFYNPESIIAANRAGSYVSIVARTETGKIVGANHLYHSAPCQKLFETGVGLVLKEYRNAGANRKTLTYLYEDYVPRHANIEELFGEAVCNHVFMQKTIEPFGFKETAIEVALMPAEAYTQEQGAKGRVATLDAFLCYIPKPHRIYFPPVYTVILRRIYNHLAYVRDIALADQPLPANKTTFATSSIFDFASVARFAVHEAGVDFADRLDYFEHQARARKVVVFQVSLNLGRAWAGHAVEILRERGYFFGGALSRWFDTDGLLMQKLECPPDFENIMLHSDFAKELLEFIRADREAVGA